MASPAIAIIGMACRFPGAASVDAFWRNLCASVESIRFFTDDELARAGVKQALRRDPAYVPATAALDGIDLFDAEFFGFTPRDAEITDPQQRLFLEIAWEALESAGYAPQRFPGRIGVFAGAGLSTYLLHNLLPRPELVARVGDLELLLANNKDYVPSRAAYKLDLRGPVVNVNTACSTGLANVHLACQSLLAFECDMALAGGVSVQVPQDRGYLYTAGGILSPDGHCRAFDARAAGTVSGNGAGAVLLKRLEEAIAHRDNIRAVMLGSAMNNDGSGKAGFTAPSVQGQAAVIAEALAVADVAPETIGYVEAHGTGTPVGDPIELAALNQVFWNGGATAAGSCRIGSVKTNFGHLDEAAGVAGLIKAALVLEHREIPPSMHFAEPNPQCDFASGPFRVATRLEPWRPSAEPRRAGVSSFGLGGTNVHAVLEQAPPVASGPSRERHLIALSARTPAALQVLTTRLADAFEVASPPPLADAAFTLLAGRRRFAHRCAVICRDVAEAVRALRAWPSEVVADRWDGAEDRPVVFAFSGHGTHYPGMARGLYASEPVFRHEFDRCAEAAAENLGRDLRQCVFDEDAAALGSMAVTQPALFALQHALSCLWRSWGIEPAAVIGHSGGEYAAAALSSAIGVEDAARLLVERGRLFDGTGPGAMLAVALREAEVEARLGARLEIAVVAAPDLCVVSGPPDAIAAFRTQAERHGIECRPVGTSVASHSARMDPIIDPFRRRVERIELNSPSIPWVSTVTGTWMARHDATDPAYWARHLRATVRFAAGIETLLRAYPGACFLEIGPGHSLASPILRHSQRAGQPVVTSVRSADEPGDDEAFLLAAAGRLWAAGARFAPAAIYAGEERRRVALPTYPFERKRCWIDPPPTAPTGLPQPSAAKRANIDEWLYLVSWRRMLPPRPRLAAEREFVFLPDRGTLARRLAARLVRDRHRVTVLEGSAAPLPDVAEIVDFRACDPLGDNSAEAERLLFELAQLGRTLGARDARARLTVLSIGVHDVIGSEPLEPLKSVILGPVQVIAQEYPELRCRSIDFADQEGATEEERLLEQLALELAGENDDAFIAWRGPHRWGQEFVPIGESQPGPPRLQQGGAYLIAGGTGEVGRTIAQYLAVNFQTRIVLTSRFGSFDATLLRRLEAAGSEVLVRRADLADEEAMRRVCLEMTERFGRIDGVIHAAGVTDADIVFRGIGETTPEQIAALFRPKLAGTLVLERVLRGHPVDFCLLISSNASTLGGLGLCAYSAASHFLDIFAAACRRRGLPWIASNWDGWPSAKTDLPSHSHIERYTMTAAEAEAAVDRVLAADVARIVVSSGDLHARLSGVRRALTGVPDEFERPAADEAQSATGADGFDAPRSEAELAVAAQFEELLGIRPIARHHDFFQLGGDSLVGSRLIARLARQFRIHLSVRALFADPSVAGLAAEIERQCVFSLAPAAPLAVDEEEGVL